MENCGCAKYPQLSRGKLGEKPILHCLCGLFREMLGEPALQDIPTEHKEAYLASYIHTLNHNERRKLKTRHACQYFGDGRLRVKFYKRMRRDIIGEVQTIQQEILGEIDQPNDRETAAAHRRACEAVMLKHGLINVHQERT